MSSVGAKHTAETSNRQTAPTSARELFVLPHDPVVHLAWEGAHQ
jgi:hypothetical protein